MLFRLLGIFKDDLEMLQTHFCSPAGTGEAEHHDSETFGDPYLVLLAGWLAGYQDRLV